MPATIVRRRPALRRRARNPQIVRCTELVPIAAAREVVDEASRWLGVLLPSRYAVRLAYRAHIIYANSPSFRRILDRPGLAARDNLYVFLRHWLAARLYADRPDLFRRLPDGYRTGEPLPADSVPLSPEARQLCSF